MIIDEYIEIKINKSNYKYYSSVLDNIENNKICKIPVSVIRRGSHVKVLVCCDICKSETEKPYRQYMDSYEKLNIYCCSPKCAQFKNKETNIQKYGFSNVFQSDEIKNKIKETNMLKYNVNYPSQSDVIRDKIIKTLNKNYGVENPMYSDEIKKRLSKTCLEKYGSISFLSSKKMDTFSNKIPESLRSDYIKYRDIVRSLTNKIKNELIENWNGYDFYDGEYIKENFKYKFYDKKYPTMDHKISIYYGFINNICYKVIANIDNIVITKRSINSSKSIKCFFK